eukprot:2275979-Rhodomonas_salina.1
MKRERYPTNGWLYVASATVQTSYCCLVPPYYTLVLLPCTLPAYTSVLLVVRRLYHPTARQYCFQCAPALHTSIVALYVASATVLHVGTAAGAPVLSVSTGHEMRVVRQLCSRTTCQYSSAVPDIRYITTGHTLL